MTSSNFPRNYPATFVTDRPDWALYGRKLMVVTEGPERGRAAGLLSPRAGSVVYANSQPGREQRAPSIGPSNGGFFHQGEWNYLDPAGEPVSIMVGSICLEGGHSDEVGAETMQDAADFLSRRGAKWQDRHGDLTLHGRVTQQPDGLLFLGGVYPWVPDRDIDVINATTISPEFFPNPEFGFQQDFVGAARVLRSALPRPDHTNPMPIAADLDEPVRERIVVTHWNPEPAPPAEPILAEVDESDIAELRRRLDEMETRFSDLVEQMFDLAAKLVTGSELTLDDRLQAFADQIAELTARIEETSGQNRPVESDPGASVDTNSGLIVPTPAT